MEWLLALGGLYLLLRSTAGGGALPFKDPATANDAELRNGLILPVGLLHLGFQRIPHKLWSTYISGDLALVYIGDYLNSIGARVPIVQLQQGRERTVRWEKKEGTKVNVQKYPVWFPATTVAGKWIAQIAPPTTIDPSALVESVVGGKAVQSGAVFVENWIKTENGKPWAVHASDCGLLCFPPGKFSGYKHERAWGIAWNCWAQGKSLNRNIRTLYMRGPNIENMFKQFAGTPGDLNEGWLKIRYRTGGRLWWDPIVHSSEDLMVAHWFNCVYLSLMGFLPLGGDRPEFLSGQARADLAAYIKAVGGAATKGKQLGQIPGGVGGRFLQEGVKSGGSSGLVAAVEQFFAVLSKGKGSGKVWWDESWKPVLVDKSYVVENSPVKLPGTLDDAHWLAP